MGGGGRADARVHRDRDGVPAAWREEGAARRPGLNAPGRAGGRRRRGFRLAGRGLFLVLSLVCLYLLLPSLLEVFTSWRDLFELEPAWIAVALGFVALSYVCVWHLQRIALQTKLWVPVALSQLSGNALGRVIPGGAAASAALQYTMLTRAGLPSARVASALTGATVLLVATVLALPLLALPAILGGAPVDPTLANAAYLGVGVLVLVLAGGVLAFVWDRPLRWVGGAVQRAVNRTLRRRVPVEGLAERLLEERNQLRRAFGRRWEAAVLASGGRWLLDYLALVACLRAVGAEPSPSLVLLAFVAAAFLGMIPLTPGGLGFVEAGLTGMLALAGVGAAAAAVATLAYRLVSYWLPIGVGGIAYAAFRRRYP